MAAYLRGGWFPEEWDIPVALGLGVVITGYMGDTIAGWISQFVPAEWLNPTSELIIGLIMFLIGGAVGGDMSRWIRLFSFGAFAVGIADAITVLLGLGTPLGTPAAGAGTVRVVSGAGGAQSSFLSQGGNSNRVNLDAVYKQGTRAALDQTIAAGAQRVADIERRKKLAEENLKALESEATLAKMDQSRYISEKTRGLGTYK